MGHPRPLFLIYFRSFQTIYRIKTVDFSVIRTRIVWVEGEQADHLTTTKAQATFNSLVRNLEIGRDWVWLSW